MSLDTPRAAPIPRTEIAAWATLAAIAVAAGFPPESHPLALVLTVAVVALATCLTRSLPGPRLVWPLLVFLAWSALSLTWTLSVHATLTGLVLATLVILAFRLALSLGPHSPALPALLAALVVWHAGQAVWQRLWGFTQALATLPADLPDAPLYVQRIGEGRAFAGFILPGHLAAFLAAATALVLGWAVTTKGARRIAYGSAAGAGLGAYLLSGSYGGLVALVAAAAIVAAIAGVRPSRKLWAGTALLALLLALAITEQRGAAILGGGYRDPVAARLGNWRRALEVATMEPVTGVGLGSFAVAHAAVLQPGDVATRHAHSGYLEVLAETGPPGLALVLVFLVGATRTSLARLAAETGADRLRRVATLIAAMTLLVHAGIDLDFAMPSLAILTAALLGCAAGGAREPEHAGPWTIAASWAVGLALLAATVAGVQSRLALEASLAEKDGARALAWAESARRWDPWRAEPWVRRGDLLAATGDTEQARAALAEAVRREPNAAWIRARAAQLSLARGEPIAAYFALREAQRLYPSGPYTAQAAQLAQAIEAALAKAKAAATEAR